MKGLRKKLAEIIAILLVIGMMPVTPGGITARADTPVTITINSTIGEPTGTSNYWTYDSDTKTLTLNSGYSFMIDNNCICNVTNNGTIISGFNCTFTGSVTNNGTIYGGGFGGSVTNNSTIYGGIFDGSVTNNTGGTISGGTFGTDVKNNGTISAGYFRRGVVTNNGTISGGRFGTDVKNNGTISGGTFQYTLINYGTILYTVHFDANGGSNTMTDQSFTHDIEQVLSENQFTRAGYDFVGWNMKPDGSGSTFANKASVKNLTLTGSVTLYAQWKEDPKVTITYGSADASMGTVDRSSEAVYQATGTASGSSAVALTGYHFVSWTDDETGKVVSTDETLVPAKVNGLNVAAAYTANFAEDSNTMAADKTSLTFADTVVGENPPEAQEVTVTNTGNTNLILPFDHDAIAEAEDFFVDPKYKSDIVLPGKTVNISVRPNAGLPVGDYNESFTIQDAAGQFHKLIISLNYTVLSKDDTPVNLVDTETGDTLNAGRNAIYASPSNASESDAEIEYCDMSISSDTATLSDARESQHFTLGKSQKLKSFTWDGVTYTKWKVFYTEDTDTCRYIYVMHNQAYEITFDGNGGTTDTASGKTNEDGYLTSLPATSRSGYTFAGWYTDKTGGTQVSKSTQFTSDATLYAHWTSSGGSTGSGSDGDTAYTGSSGKWLQDSTGWWYRNADGTWPSNTWKQIGGKWYHFDESGYMQTGWILDNGKWYYLDGSGAMVTGYFHAPDGYWYYFRADGSMAVGDVTVDGKQRHFNDQLPPKPTYDKDPDTGIWYPNGNTDLPYGAETE